MAAVAGRNGEPFFGPAEPVRSPEFPDFDAIDRQRQELLGRRESNGRGQPAGVLERRRSGRLSKAFFSSLARAATRAARAVAVQIALEPPDQVLEVVGLASQSGRRAGRSPARCLLDSSACCFWRCSISSVSRGLSSASVLRSRSRRSRSSAMSLRSARKLRQIGRTATSVSCRISGSTAPSRMAERSDCSASSGRHQDDRRRWRPIRCSAASTSPMTPRRSSSDLRNACSRSSSGWSRSLVWVISASMARTRAADSIS